ncbi:DUF308 domain-containing protein [Candidatus Saccharibacteria bacterium]|nr:DUF308 domain-containing protein [Candidatus Saccharibacteria bacterium]
MAHIKRSYIDVHWLIYIIRGVVGTLIGMLLLFYRGGDTELLKITTMVYLLLIAVIDFFIAIFRAHRKEGWGVSIITAVFEAAVAIAMMLVLNNSTDNAWYIIAASYTAIRGIFELIIAFKTTIDPTDRFIWLLSGIFGCVTAAAIFNVDSFGMQFFGAYLILIGEANLIYGVHNKNQKIEDSIARKEARRKK